MLLVRIMFQMGKGISLVLLMTAIAIGYLLHKHLKKIVVLQLVLAFVSFVTLVPKVIFAFQQNNSDWNQVSKDMLEAKLIKTPNIFVIQPDGYVNSADLKKAPYSYDNSNFELWLSGRGFIDYENFRSNYYSTLTSNASMFAMKHHYYSNTNPNTVKTYNANDVIVGDENNVLKILKNNDYKSFLLTDNTYFLSNRRALFYDHTNVPLEDVFYFSVGDLPNVNISSDLTRALDSLTHFPNFFFIEKTIPAHITHREEWSQGAEKEKNNYLERLEGGNKWLKNQINTILEFDEDAMIIIVADHGGYVGMDYTKEVYERKLSEEETISTFSSILSIKWPKTIHPEGLEFKTNVNLFRQIFYGLSGDAVFLKDQEKNSSYLPFIEDGKAIYYQVLDEDRNKTFLPYNDQE